MYTHKSLKKHEKYGKQDEKVSNDKKKIIGENIYLYV